MQTEGRSNSDSAWYDHDEFYSPILQNILRLRETGRNPTNIVKAYVVPGLMHDLLSVKGLNKAGYSVHNHPDPEQSGVYAVINNKIDKSKPISILGGM